MILEERDGDTGCFCVCNNADLPKIAGKLVLRVCDHRHHPPPHQQNLPTMGIKSKPLSILSTNCRLEQTYFRRMSLRHQSKRNQKLLWPKSRNRPFPLTTCDLY